MQGFDSSFPAFRAHPRPPGPEMYRGWGVTFGHVCRRSPKCTGTNCVGVPTWDGSEGCSGQLLEDRFKAANWAPMGPIWAPPHPPETPGRRNRTPACLHAPLVALVSGRRPDSSRPRVFPDSPGDSTLAAGGAPPSHREPPWGLHPPTERPPGGSILPQRAPLGAPSSRREPPRGLHPPTESPAPRGGILLHPGGFWWLSSEQPPNRSKVPL